MNAIDLLKADHERVKALLTQLSESTERGVKKRTELLAKLEAEISLHTKLEEEILYPAFRKAGGKEQEISVDGSKVKIFVIPTNEELVIARDTKTICLPLVK